MRILIVHQYFLGENEAGGSRWNQFAKYWVEAGHEVIVLAGMVHYTSGLKGPEYKGKLIVREEIQPGLTVYRCHVSESYNKSFMGRAWAYMSFTFWSTVAAIFKAGRPDVILATSPPLTVGPTMGLLSTLWRVPAVFEVRDLWPESAINTGVLTSRPLIKLGFLMEASAYYRAKWINVLTPAFKDVLVSKKGVSPDRISMIPNGADLDLMQPGPRDNRVRKELGLEGKFIVSYFGAHGRANHVGQILDVAAKVRDTHQDICFMLVGDGMEKQMLKERAQTEGLSNVVFVDSVAKNQVADYLNASDVCTAVLLKIDTFKTVYPNKVFDYMCCERPIIIGIDGVARKLIADAGAGLYAEPENSDSFIEAMMTLYNDPELGREMGRRGCEHVKLHYDRRKLAQEYLTIMKNVAEKG
jgi:glycosyltransferase involved in cell wall biosynthesis